MLPSCRRRCNNQSDSQGSPKCNMQPHSNTNCWGGGWIMGTTEMPRPACAWEGMDSDSMLLQYSSRLLQKDQY
eukprot:scaffold351802_cov175-Cyclotella_meneghiniana.AAC.1